MKKIISLVIAAMMAVSVLAVSALPAMAADTVKSPTAATLQDGKVKLTVNGENRQGVTYKRSSTNANEITFTYSGEGTLTGWENNLVSLGLVEGTDFKAVMNADKSYTITFITTKAIDTWNAGTVVVNALVDFGTTTTVTDEATTAEEEEDEADEDTTEAAEAKKNTSSKSPATGAPTAAVAGAVAAAGAGFAVLAATKKRDAE